MTKFQELAPRLMRDLLSEPKFQFALDDAAAITGNAAYECAGFEKLQEIAPTVKGSKGGWGFFQWTGSRRTAFEAWCKRKGFAPDSYEANYSFLVRELLTSEAKTVQAVKAANGLDAKVKAFEAKYERAGVKAYAKRLDWAKKALAEYQKAAPAPAPKPAPAPIPKHVDPPPATSMWLARLLMWLGLMHKPAPPPVVPPGDGYSELVEQVQKRLQALNYPEVGLADGHMGKKTRDAIVAFASEQTPRLASTGEIDDALLAALAKAKPRAVAANRAQTTAKDLRDAGNQQAQALSGMGWLGNALGLGGILGGLNETGVFDSIKNAADTTTNTLSTIQAAVLSVIGVVQWIITHWWIFAILAGVWTVYKVTVAVLNLVVLFRQGILQRAAVRSPDV